MDRRTIDSPTQRIRSHAVHIDNRELISVTGVKDVMSFNDQEVSLLTECGQMNIDGNGLHITKLNLEDGNVVIEGEVVSLDYDDAQKPKGSVFSRMFG